MRQATVSIVLGAVLLSIGSIYLFAKNIWLCLKTTMRLPTPLWATISLVLLCCSYVYLKIQSSNPQNNNYKIKLSQTAMNILEFFGKQDDIGLTTKELSEIFKTTFNQTQLAIESLRRFDFLHAKHEYVGDQRYWLSPEGREFLGEKNIL